MTRSSDSESSDDSDKGIRYKTDSIRNKNENNSDSSRQPIHQKRKHHSRRRQNYSSDDEEYQRHKRNKEKKHRKESYYKRSRNHSSSENRISRHKNIVEVGNKSSSNLTAIPTEKEKHSEDKGNSDSSFGPALPPHVSKVNSNISISETEIENKSVDLTVGPMLPPHLMKSSSDSTQSEDINLTKKETHIIGPALPLHLQTSTIEVKPQQEEDEINTEGPKIIRDNSQEIIGPALPPHLQKSTNETHPQEISVEEGKIKSENSPKIIGPALPPHLQKTTKTKDSDQEQETPSNAVIGPTLPPHLRKQLAEASPCIVQQDSDDEDCYGPLPEGARLTKSHLELEERSWQLKINQLNPGVDEPKREEWMIELPAVKAANLGLGPRTFRMKGTPDLSDRSSWTETPQDKEKKKRENVEPDTDLKKEAERKCLQKRDKEQEEIVKKSKRSSESLVDMHKKKMKEKKKDEPASTERRPFSRDVDLQVNRFDEAQKKAVLKKAQLLDDRFSSGQSKFL